MVDIIGPSANLVSSALTGSKSVDSVESGRKQAVLNDATSTEVVDEVSISNEAMDIGRVMEIVQEAKARIEGEPKVTLSNDSERLSMLV